MCIIIQQIWNYDVCSFGALNCKITKLFLQQKDHSWWGEEPNNYIIVHEPCEW